jgi:aryl-alcohol dehydrogenase-like predicted oxidoreductase
MVKSLNYMHYKPLGKSRLRVSGLCLGTITFVEVGRQYVYGETVKRIDNHRTGRSGEAA